MGRKVIICTPHHLWQPEGNDGSLWECQKCGVIRHIHEFYGLGHGF